ncbi:unnamed protein product, partial [Candidula unifasciata]
GWAWCEVLDMNTFYYYHIPASERRRIESLETFDEYEELNLKYSHYFILTASTVSLNRSLIGEGVFPPAVNCYPPISNIVSINRLAENAQSVRRFGHASSLVQGRYAVSTGGFGEIDGRHQRLTEITVTDMQTFQSSHILCCPTDLQCSRMHHASVSLSDGATFLIGGRQSPYFMCNQMLKICLNVVPEQGDLTQKFEDKHCSDHSADDNKQNLPPGVASNVRATGQSTGGSHQSSTLTESSVSSQSTTDLTRELGDTHLEKPGCDSRTCDHVQSSFPCDSNLDPESAHQENGSDSDFSCSFHMGCVHISVVNQKGGVPRERWRHAATDVVINGQEKIFLHGGKTKTGEVLGDSYLFDPFSHVWEQLSCVGDVPGALHSHCVSHWNGQVVLTGGLNVASLPSEDVFLLNLTTKIWEKLPITGNFYARYSHTSHLVHEDILLLVGGVNLHHPPPGVAVINLRTRKALEFALPEQDKSSLLMFHRHTSVKLDEDKIVVLGGGGNCFSFGTHLNRTPVVLGVGSCIDSVR